MVKLAMFFVLMGSIYLGMGYIDKKYPYLWAGAAVINFAAALAEMLVVFSH